MKFILGGDIGWGRCACAMSWCYLNFTFDFGSARMFSIAIFETYFSYFQYIWIVLTDYSNVLLPHCAIYIDSCTLFYKFYSLIKFSLLINAVNFLWTYLVAVVKFLYYITYTVCSVSFLIFVLFPIQLSWCILSIYGQRLH